MSLHRTLATPFAVDVTRSLSPLRLGAHDRTVTVTRGAVGLAMRTPLGDATIVGRQVGSDIDVEAWGDGAQWALDGAPGLFGCLDDRAGFDPVDPLVRRLHRAADGLRFPRTGRVLDAVLRAVLAQRVTGFEAKRSFRLLVERWGTPAPGPLDLMLAPHPEVIAALGYYDLHVIGVEKARADTLLRVCAHAPRLEQMASSAPEQLRGRLEAIPGVGPWTSAEVARATLGDADAVSVGDYHLKHLVSWALAAEPRGTDERMLELLEPFAGHRGRVCALLEGSPLSPPRYGPKQRIRSIARQ